MVRWSGGPYASLGRGLLVGYPDGAPYTGEASSAVPRRRGYRAMLPGRPVAASAHQYYMHTGESTSTPKGRSSPGAQIGFVQSDPCSETSAIQNTGSTQAQAKGH